MGAAIIILTICLAFVAILFFIGLIVFFVLMGNKSSTDTDKKDPDSDQTKKLPTKRVTEAVVIPVQKVVEQSPKETKKPSYVITYSEMDDDDKMPVRESKTVGCSPRSESKSVILSSRTNTHTTSMAGVSQVSVPISSIPINSSANIGTGISQRSTDTGSVSTNASTSQRFSKSTTSSQATGKSFVGSQATNTSRSSNDYSPPPEHLRDFMKNRKPIVNYESDNSITPLSDGIQLYSSLDTGDMDSVELVSNGNAGYKKISTNIIDANIIDAVEYRGNKIFLFRNGDMKFPDSVRESNIYIHRLAVYEDGLYGMGRDKRLYTYSKSNKWRKVLWSPDNIHHISATMNEKYLWIQTGRTGFLYKSGKILLETPIEKLSHRNYGYSNDEYVIVIDDVMSYYRDDKLVKKYNNVIDALVTYHHDVITTSNPNERLCYVGWNVQLVENTSLSVE